MAEEATLNPSCPAPDELRAFLNGQAGDGRNDWLKAHVASCASCADYLGKLDTCDSLEAGARQSERLDLLMPDVVRQLVDSARNRDAAAVSAIGLPSGDTPEAPAASSRSLPEPARDVTEPDRLGPYHILDVLGEGGMGVVFRALDTRLGRVVALKIMRPESGRSSSLGARFLQESRAVAALRHEHIVPIFDVGETSGLAYYTMAYIEGRNLAKEVAGGPLEPRRAARLMWQVAEGIASAHARGVIHRDLKPANILIDAEDRAYVTDFGLAKQRDGGLDALTETGQVMGTPSFMPPEQALGDRDRVGPRSDVYALGATLYCLLTARPPFQAASAVETLKHVVEREPAPPQLLNPAVGRDLNTICLKCLEKGPERRFASAAAVAEDLRRFLDGRPILARPVSRLGRLTRWARRNRGLAAALLVLGLVLLTTTTLAVLAANRFHDLAENETNLRHEVEATQDATRRNLYYSEMLVASGLARSPSGIFQLRELVKRWEPEPGTADLRGWEWYLFQAMSAGPERTIRFGQDGASLGWRPDGKRLAVGLFTEGALYDPDTAASIERIAAGGGQVRWSPDGKLLAAHSDQRFEVIEVASGRALGGLNHGQRIHDFVWTPGRRQLRFMDATKAVFAWDVGTSAAGRALCRLPASTHIDGAFSPDGRLFASEFSWQNPGDAKTPPSREDWLNVWDAETGKEVHRFAWDHWGLTAVAWSGDGQRLAAGDFQGHLKVWDTSSGALAWSKPADGNQLTALAWSADRRRLAFADQRFVIGVAEPGADQEIVRLAGHEHLVAALAWSPDGRRLASLTRDGVLLEWDLSHVTPAWARNLHDRPVKPPYASAAWSRDGGRLASSFQNQGTSLWDAQTGERLGQFPGVCAAWSHDDRHLAFVLGETIYLRDGDGKATIKSHELRGQNKRLAWHPHDSRLAIRAADRIWLWDISGNEPPERVWGEAVPAGEIPYVTSSALAWSPDGRRLAFGDSVHRKVVLLDAQTRRPVSELPLPRSAMRALAWSPDSKLLAVSDEDGALQLWDIDTGTVTRTLLGHTLLVQALAWHPDGTRLASASEDRTIRVWDTRTGSVTFTVEFEGEAQAVAWSDDGRKLAALGTDGILRVWDATRGYVP